jgi:hypothetical protein
MLEFKATLRIFSQGYTLVELTKILGDPTRGYSIGDSYSRNKKSREQTFWSLESSSLPTDDFESHLNDITSFVNSKEQDLVNLRNKCELDIFCMLSSDNGQGSATLPSQVLKKVSRYDLDIVLDVYADE